MLVYRQISVVPSSLLRVRVYARHGEQPPKELDPRRSMVVPDEARVGGGDPAETAELVEGSFTSLFSGPEQRASVRSPASALSVTASKKERREANSAAPTRVRCGARMLSTSAVWVWATVASRQVVWEKSAGTWVESGPTGSQESCQNDVRRPSPTDTRVREW
jgi:hypothetical protein